jgi:lipid-binding SYLF domain-containing protein
LKEGEEGVNCKSVTYAVLAVSAVGCGAFQEQRGSGADVADRNGGEQRRAEILRIADESLEQLRQQNPSAADLLERAYGHAVFATTKAGLFVTGAGGTGVARERATGEETFMHLGSAGFGFGGGFENYRLVLLLEDEQTYRDFVSGQWDGSLSAQAAAGTAGIAAEEQFLEGIRAYRITDRGLMAQVDASGTRFWASGRLNEEAAPTRVATADDAERDEDIERDDAGPQIATGEAESTVR